MPSDLATKYRGYAAKCLVIARRQDNQGDKLTLIDIAQAWAELAEKIDEESAHTPPGRES
jgi:hypothetical protein